MQIRTLALGVMLSLVAAVAAQDAAKVESFSPQGRSRTYGRSSRASRNRW